MVQSRVMVDGDLDMTVDDWAADRGVAQAAAAIAAAALTLPNSPSQFYLMNSASAQTLTVPANLSKWPIGGVLTVIQMGAGATTIAAGAGVTFRPGNVVTGGQYKIAQLIKIGANEWVGLS